MITNSILFFISPSRIECNKITNASTHFQSEMKRMILFNNTLGFEKGRSHLEFNDQMSTRSFRH